jgi:hypothetical protein
LLALRVFDELLDGHRPSSHGDLVIVERWRVANVRLDRQELGPIGHRAAMRASPNTGRTRSRRIDS